MRHNFYEEYKDRMTYEDMPKAAADTLRETFRAFAERRHAPVEKLMPFVERYITAIEGKAENKSQILRNYETVIDYLEMPAYEKEGLRIINSLEFNA